MRDTDSPDAAAGSEQPAGPELVGTGDPESVSSISATTEHPDAIARAQPSTGIQAPAGKQPSAGNQQPVSRQKPGAGLGRRMTDLTAGALAPLAPLGRTWRRLRPSRPAATVGLRAAPSDAAGLALARLTVLPAVLVVAWLVPGLPLLLGGSFEPVAMLLISVPLAAALMVNGLRAVPASWPGHGGSSGPVRGWTTWFGLLGTVAIVAGLTAWQLRESSESVIVLRDAGTYLQAGYWIAQHGSLPIPQALSAFGGPHPGLSFASTGFLAHGTSIVPAVTPGLPMLLAAGFWAHGLTGAGAVGPLLGGLAELSFAGLVARLVGPQWAPAGALILGLSLPQQYVSRTSLSETVLQIVLFGGLCLLADSMVLRSVTVTGAADARSAASGPAVADTVVEVPDIVAASDTLVLRPIGTARPRRVRRVAAQAGRLASFDWASWLTPDRALACLSGVALGFGPLVCLDGLLYLLPVIPFGAILVVGRRPQAIPFLAGFILGAVYGGLGAFLLDRPFVDTVGTTVAIAGVAAVWLLALVVIAGQLTRLGSVRRAVPRLLGRVPLRWLPELGALVVAAVLIGLAVRPYVQSVHGHPSVAVSRFIASLQRQQGLLVDPTRLYSEQTLYWVIWYIGLPTVLLGGFGLVLLVRRSLRALLTWRDPDRKWRIWGLPLAICCIGAATVLWKPDIVPDQPWASRRLVVVVLPALIIGALWAASWLTVRARNRGASTLTAAVVGLFCSAAMLVPTVSTTFGLGLSHAGKSGGLHPVAQGMALQRTGVGQDEAVSVLCADIPGKASVVIVDRVTAERFSQVIRGMCGVPTASMAGQPPGAVQSVLRGISAAGRRPVLLASAAGRLASFGGNPVRILDLVTTEDPHQLIQLPTAPAQVQYVLWMTAPAPSGAGI